MSRLRCADVAEGQELPPLQVRLTRADLIRYAGASGDFNPIHWSDRAAREAGLPGVIAHGMLTMALATRLVTNWAGDPGVVVDCAVRFTRPVVVPDNADGSLIELSGKVAKRHDDGTVEVTITARAAGQPVLGQARATVALT
ncbi:MAG: MaoC family dehydratase [Actinomycetota bacterium]|nr:MaoC family dehydratase [Actinomycetota bacterium]MDQ3899580.1 MaoC family dehydratase [Actinomycetota bacterium]